MVRGELKERMSLLAQDAEKRKQLARLRRETLRKVQFLSSKSTIDARDVYHLIKDFFKEFLTQPYEFTIEELRFELKKIYITNTERDRIAAILAQLHKIEYTDIDLSRAELGKLLGEFKEVVEHLVMTHSNPRSFFAKVRAFFLKEQMEPEIIIAELPVIEHEDASGIRLRTLVEECYVSLDAHKLYRAKAAYQALISEYGTLSEDERKRFYPLIDQTYRDILSRAEMSK